MSNKLNITDKVTDAMVKMSEGNPGCLTFLMELIKTKDLIKCCIRLDSMGMYGSEIYQLWNDCCDRDTEKTRKIILEYPEEDIISHVRNGEGYGTKFD